MPKKTRDDSADAIKRKPPAKSNVVMNSQEGAVAPAISQLVEIFSERMPEVEFPGVSAGSLRQGHQSVEDANAALNKAKQVLLQATEKVAELEGALTESRAQLLKDALRAKGYAMIFAEDDTALLEQVRGLNLKFKKPKAPKKPKVVKPKAKAGVKKAKSAMKIEDISDDDEEHEESVTMDPDFDAIDDDADMAA